METYFHFSADVTILFSGWHITSAGGLIGSCAVICILAFFYEVLKTFRGLHLRNAATNVKQQLVEKPSEKTQILEKYAEGEINIFSWPHVIQTLLQILQTFIGYMLMLIIMTYNTWLLLSILIGAGIGYFATAWKRSVAVDVEERRNTTTD